MKSKIIKEKCDKFLEDIKTAQFGLAELREICPHESTFRGLYYYRVGQSEEVDICLYCRKPMENYFNSHLHFTEVKYSQICTLCKPNGDCNCTMANEIVKQYFQLSNNDR